MHVCGTCRRRRRRRVERYPNRTEWWVVGIMVVNCLSTWQKNSLVVKCFLCSKKELKIRWKCIDNIIAYDQITKITSILFIDLNQSHKFIISMAHSEPTWHGRWYQFSTPIKVVAKKIVEGPWKQAIGSITNILRIIFKNHKRIMHVYVKFFDRANVIVKHNVLRWKRFSTSKLFDWGRESVVNSQIIFA